MATQAITVDSLSKDERAFIVAGLQLRRASILRANKSETNADIVRIRSKEADEINALILKFS